MYQRRLLNRNPVVKRERRALLITKHMDLDSIDDDMFAVRDKTYWFLVARFHYCANLMETAEERLGVLQAFSGAKPNDRTPTDKARERLRAEFVRLRTAHFAQLKHERCEEPGDWLPCHVCWAPSTHRHHVIQLQHGGDNHPRNIVLLCDSCHEDIHPWMKNTPKKIQPAKSKRKKRTEGLHQPFRKALQKNSNAKFKGPHPIMAEMTGKGGFTRAVVEKHGVSWPLTMGWLQRLTKDWEG